MFSELRYEEIGAIGEFEDSINCLLFSPDGEWLAAGGDDGRLVFIDPQSSLFKDVIISQAPVTSLAWKSPSKGYTVFVGYGSGEIMEYHIGSKPCYPNASHIRALSLPIEGLQYDPYQDALAGISGRDVFVLQFKSNGEASSPRTLPPPALELQDPAADKEVSPCSIHLIDDGKALVVSYVYHGVVCWSIETHDVLWRLRPETRIGRSAISPDQRSLVICNLFDGFDRYRIDRSKRVQSYPSGKGGTIALPVVFIHDGDALLFGGACGAARVVDTDDGSLIQTLGHSEAQVIQAIAYVKVDQARRLIATGSSESGQSNLIKIWLAVCQDDASASRPSQPNDDPFTSRSLSDAHVSKESCQTQAPTHDVTSSPEPQPTAPDSQGKGGCLGISQRVNGPLESNRTPPPSPALRNFRFHVYWMSKLICYALIFLLIWDFRGFLPTSLHHPALPATDDAGTTYGRSDSYLLRWAWLSVRALLGVYPRLADAMNNVLQSLRAAS